VDFWIPDQVRIDKKNFFSETWLIANLIELKIYPLNCMKNNMKNFPKHTINILTQSSKGAS